jgi:hypothetical protein
MGLGWDFRLISVKVYQMAKNCSEKLTLAGYMDGNPGFMKAEILLHVLISY